MIEVNKEELRRLAEAARELRADIESVVAYGEFKKAANPAAILSLLNENKALLEQVATLQSGANSWQSGYDKGREMGGRNRASEVDQLRAENERLLGLLVQCALSAATLRSDAPHYANHSGFNEKFTDAIRKASGVNIGHGVASPKYPSQADAIAAMANEGGENS